ncbi:MAG: flavodoxin family protein [Anaerolineae bacterium]|nr:MAG: flavodoxin family protein [Anaerolineae bacterium]
MKSLIVYFSRYGNTQKIAEAMAGRLGSAGPVRVLSVDQLTASDLTGADLVVAGTPTHRMNLPQAVRPMLDRLPRRVLRATPVAAFDTSYKMSAWLARFTAARKLLRKLRKLGGKRVLPPETFHVVEREGPLYEDEIERAREWAGLILERLDGR